jgi:GT2 family glycosyltransferase
MTVSMRIAVVIPCKDEAPTLAACLESVRTQEPAPAVIVVIDNGSTDGSLEIARARADIVLQSDASTIGRLRNLGAAAVEAVDCCDAFAFLDADCVAVAGWLNEGRCALEKADVVGARTAASHDAGWVARRWAWIERRLSPEASYVGSANMLVRGVTFNAIGGYDESLLASEDVDLCRRAEAAGGRVQVVPAMRVVHLGSPSGLRQFIARQLWHASANGWWWRMSLRGRALVALSGVWAGSGAVAIVLARRRSESWAPAGWALGTVVGAGVLGASVGGPRDAFRDGLLLSLWSLAHGARILPGLRRSAPAGGS